MSHSLERLAYRLNDELAGAIHDLRRENRELIKLAHDAQEECRRVIEINDRARDALLRCAAGKLSCEEAQTLLEELDQMDAARKARDRGDPQIGYNGVSGLANKEVTR